MLVWRISGTGSCIRKGAVGVSLPETFDIKELDKAFLKNIDAVEKGKEEIFNISEAARQEYTRVKVILDDIRAELDQTIDEVDEVEHLFQRARIKLMQVSKEFANYSEEEIREAYDTAYNLQLRLSTARERERELKKSRDELDRTMRRLKEMVQRSEKMVSQMSIAAEVLKGNLEIASKAFADMQNRYLYGVQVVVAQEEERKRVARELHDGPVQSLANVALRADYCQKIHEAGNDSVEVSKEMAEIKKLVQDILVEMRQIIFDLRPMSLDDLGLLPALTRYITIVQKNTPVIIDIVDIGEETRLHPAVEVALFRLIQEAINNALKHSGCSNITIRVEFTEDDVIVQIIDNGFGFDLQEAKKVASENQNFGLLGMEERVRLLGGQFGVETGYGQGTKVWARVAHNISGGEYNGS